jgi:hypothetical protein
MAPGVVSLMGSAMPGMPEQSKALIYPSMTKRMFARIPA